jgi:hypothetical protein
MRTKLKLQYFIKIRDSHREKKNQSFSLIILAKSNQEKITTQRKKKKISTQRRRTNKSRYRRRTKNHTTGRRAFKKRQYSRKN